MQQNEIIAQKKNKNVLNSLNNSFLKFIDNTKDIYKESKRKFKNFTNKINNKSNKKKNKIK